MNEKIKEAVEKYQCPGCVCGMDTSCYEKWEFGVGCGKHVAGTRVMPSIGLIWLGMPKGFCRLGPMENKIRPEMHESLSALNKVYGKTPKVDSIKNEGFYNKYNVPVWKHRTSEGHILVRGISPRVNRPFLHILLSDEGYDTIRCEEITAEEMKEMD